MMRLMRWLAAVRYDARFACRAVLRSPRVTAAAVLTLALGVGFNSAIFSAVESLQRTCRRAQRPVLIR